MGFPRAAVDVDLRTGALFSWQTGRDGTTLAPRVGTTGALARATDAAAADSAGHVYTLLVNQPRWHVPDLAADPAVGLLIEPARTNLVLQSENFGTTWSATGSPTRVAGANIESNISLDLIGDTSGAARAFYTQSITFTGNAVKSFAVAVKKGTSASTLVRVYNATTAANVLVATVAWTGTAPNVTATTGTYLAAQPFVNGIYWLLFQTTSVTAANAHTIELSPAATSTSDTASQGNVYMGGVQAENGPVPTSYLKTTTGTRARATETCVFTIDFRPQQLTVAGELSWTGATAAALSAVAAAEADGSTHGVFALGDSNSGAGRETLALEILTGAGAPTARLSHLVNGAGATCDVVLTGMVPPIQYVATLDDNAAVALTVTDGANATASAQSSIPGIALQAMFDNNRLWIGAREGGANPGVFTARAFAIRSGGLPIERQVATSTGTLAVRPAMSGTGTVKQKTTGTGSMAVVFTMSGQQSAQQVTGSGSLAVAQAYVGTGSVPPADFTGTGALAVALTMWGVSSEFVETFAYGAVEGWHDGGAGIPLNADDVATGTLVCFAVPTPTDFVASGSGTFTVSVNASIIAQSFVTGAPDSVVAPTYWRLRSADGASYLQATASSVVLNDTNVAIGDTVAIALTLTP